MEKLDAIQKLAGHDTAKKIASEYSAKYAYLSKSLTKKDPIRFARLKANEYLDNMLELLIKENQ